MPRKCQIMQDGPPDGSSSQTVVAGGVGTIGAGPNQEECLGDTQSVVCTCQI